MYIIANFFLNLFVYIFPNLILPNISKNIDRQLTKITLFNTVCILLMDVIFYSEIKMNNFLNHTLFLLYYYYIAKYYFLYYNITLSK